MSLPDDPQINPYEPPAPIPAVIAGDADAAVKAKLKKFRDQIHALGAFWIIIGGIAAGVGVFLVTTLEEARIEGSPVVGAIVIVSGGAWIDLGIATCLKQMWAVYIGLALSYLSVIGNLLRFNVCALIILAAVILQAHRVIGWARELRKMGIQLNARPA
jgi:hypothetical protein